MISDILPQSAHLASSLLSRLLGQLGHKISLQIGPLTLIYSFEEEYLQYRCNMPGGNKTDE